MGYRGMNRVIGHGSGLDIDKRSNHHPTNGVRNVDVVIRADLLDWDIQLVKMIISMETGERIDIINLRRAGTEMMAIST
jgi:hypothetical protein